MTYWRKILKLCIYIKNEVIKKVRGERYGGNRGRKKNEKILTERENRI